jgi:hypothetical protein
MNKKYSEMTPEEKVKKQAYQRNWYLKNSRKKGNKKPAAAAPQRGGAVQPVKLEFTPLSDGVNPGEALFYISDTLQNILAELKRISQACEKAGRIP